MSDELTAFLNFNFEVKRVTIKVAEGDTMSTANRWQLNWREYLAKLAELGIDGGSDNRPTLMRYGQPMPESVVFDELMMFQSGLRADLAEVVKNKRIPWSMFHRIFGETDGIIVKYMLNPGFRGEVTPANINELGLSAYYDASTYRTYIMAIIRELIVSRVFFYLRLDDNGLFYFGGLAPPKIEAPQPEFVAAKPEPAVSMAEPVVAKAEPVVARAEIVTPKPEIASMKIEPARSDDSSLPFDDSLINELTNILPWVGENGRAAPNVKRESAPASKREPVEESEVSEALTMTPAAVSGSGAAGKAKPRVTGAAGSGKSKAKRPTAVLPGLKRPEPPVSEDGPAAQSEAEPLMGKEAALSPKKGRAAAAKSKPLEIPEALQASETSQVAEALQESETPQVAEALQAYETPQVAESRQILESPEASEAIKTALAAKAQDAPEIAEAAKRFEASEASDSSDDSDAFEYFEISGDYRAQAEPLKPGPVIGAQAGPGAFSEDADVQDGGGLAGAPASSAEDKTAKAAEAIIAGWVKASKGCSQEEGKDDLHSKVDDANDIIEAMDEAIKELPATLEGEPGRAAIVSEIVEDMDDDARESEAEESGHDDSAQLALSPLKAAAEELMTESGEEDSGDLDASGEAEDLSPEFGEEASGDLAASEDAQSEALKMDAANGGYAWPASNRQEPEEDDEFIELVIPSLEAAVLAQPSENSEAQGEGRASAAVEAEAGKREGSPQGADGREIEPLGDFDDGCGAGPLARSGASEAALGSGFSAFGFEVFEGEAASRGGAEDEPDEPMFLADLEDDEIFEIVSPLAEEEEDESLTLSTIGGAKAKSAPVAARESREPSPSSLSIEDFERIIMGEAPQAGWPLPHSATGGLISEGGNAKAPQADDPLPLSAESHLVLKGEAAKAPQSDAPLSLFAVGELISEGEIATAHQADDPLPLSATRGLDSEGEIAKASHADEPLSLSAIGERISDAETVEAPQADDSLSHSAAGEKDSQGEIAKAPQADEPLPLSALGERSAEPASLAAQSQDEPISLSGAGTEIIEFPAKDAYDELGLALGADDSLPDDLVDGGLAQEEFNLEADEPLELLELAEEDDILEEGVFEEGLAEEVAGGALETNLERDGEAEVYEEDFDDIDFLPVEFKVATLEHRLAMKLKERNLSAFQVDLFRNLSQRKINGL